MNRNPNVLTVPSRSGTLSHSTAPTAPNMARKANIERRDAVFLMARRIRFRFRLAACDRVMRRRHPDVRYYAPEGANGYLVDQIREIVSDTSLAPIKSHRKIYIIDRVDMLGTAAANAFLKTLEEPPDDVVMILLGRTRESVLPTIVSRCQVVPFRLIPPTEAAGIVRQNTGASLEQSRIAIEACGGSLTRAVEFLRAPGNERLRFRTEVIEVLASLRRADSWDVIEYGARLVTDAKLPLDQVRANQEAELAENADFLEKSALRQIEARNKRQMTAKSLECLRQLTSIVRTWLRDVMVTCADAPELVINYDARESIQDAASHTDVARVSEALRSVDRCDTAISYNVSPETCLDALLFDVREVFDDTGSSH